MLCRKESSWPNKAPLKCVKTFISDISSVRYNISDWPLYVSQQLFYSQSMPTRIFTGNNAYEYSYWACHTSTTKEFKERVHEERVDIAN